MQYLFRCDSCGELTQVRRSLEDRNNAPDCPSCTVAMSRQFSVPQLITEPEHLKEVNNNYPGMSATDALERMKREDAEYEAVDYSMIPRKRTAKQIFAESPSMNELIKKVS